MMIKIFHYITRAQVVNRKCVYVSISYMLRMILPQEVFVCFVNLHYNESCVFKAGKGWCLRWHGFQFHVLNWAQTELLKSGPVSRTLGRIKTTYWLTLLLDNWAPIKCFVRTVSQAFRIAPDPMRLLQQLRTFDWRAFTAKIFGCCCSSTSNQLPVWTRILI